MKACVIKLAQAAPDDVSGIATLIAEGQLDPKTIVAIMGKTEGNGCVNDFTRGFAVQSLRTFLATQAGTEVADRIIYVMSGGTEGILSPHLTIFTQADSPPEATPRLSLALGLQRTRDFCPEEIGTLTMVDVVAEAVNRAIAAANLAPEHIHFVQIKCPLIKSTVEANGLQTHNSYTSMAYSRGASALGVAVALGEIDRERLTQADIGSNYHLYSTVASTSAGSELHHCEIIVMGNSPTATSDYIIGHSVMHHALDSDAVKAAIASTGQSPEQIVTLFAKAEADPSGYILGQRHTMLDDSDISHTRMARAVVGAVVAAIVQDPMVYVSGGGEHQGPAGGGPVAAIARL